MDVINVKDFEKRYGEKVVHRGVSFCVKPGECVGLIGGSGSGKSVLLRSLIGLEKPDQGSVTINGTDITGFRESELVEVRKKVAYVFQGGALFDSMSVYENLAYPLREHTNYAETKIRQIISDQLTEFGLEGSEPLFPASLSGGMQKRLGLARAIIIGPEVVLYDEPTAGLDPYNTRKIQEMILRLKSKGVTSILVTHDMPSAFAVCDRIMLLLKGKIVEEGTPEELKTAEHETLKRFIDGLET